MPRHLLLIIPLASIMLASCASPTAEESLEHAREAMHRGHYDQARRICDDLAERPDTVAEHLGALSIIYMQLAQHASQDDAFELALGCSRSAYDTDSARTAAYYDNLPADELPEARLLMSIADMASHAPSSGAEPDSIPTHE